MEELEEIGKSCFYFIRLKILFTIKFLIHSVWKLEKDKLQKELAEALLRIDALIAEKNDWVKKFDVITEGSMKVSRVWIKNIIFLLFFASFSTFTSIAIKAYKLHSSA